MSDMVVQRFFILFGPVVQGDAMRQHGIMRVGDGGGDTVAALHRWSALPRPCPLHGCGCSRSFCFLFRFFGSSSFLAYLFLTWVTCDRCHGDRLLLFYGWRSAAHRGATTTQLVGWSPVQPSTQVGDKQRVLHICQSSQSRHFGICEAVRLCRPCPRTDPTTYPKRPKGRQTLCCIRLRFLHAPWSGR